MPAEGGPRIERHVTCLGCGCACDDITVTVRDGRIMGTEQACQVGAAWFGDGGTPARAALDGRDVALDDALSAAARLLQEAPRRLVLLAPDVSMEAQRLAVTLADVCAASLDSVSSSTVAHSILAGQETGRATTTLGELRNRADVVVFWDVDAGRYPRFAERYAPEPVGLYVPDGRRGRRVVSVGVRRDHWPEADVAMRVEPEDEVPTLTALAALLGDADFRMGQGLAWAHARALADVLLGGRYAVVVADAEPALGTPQAGARSRAGALWRVSHALNHRVRGGVVALRAGGNRTGAEAVMTSATGYPMAVDYARGVPLYRPHDGSAAARLAAGTIDAALVVGDARLIDAAVLAGLTTVPCAVVGPKASDGPLAGSRVVVDSARAGVHEEGTALRMDDVPLPLRALLPGAPSARDLMASLLAMVARRQRSAGAASVPRP